MPQQSKEAKIILAIQATRKDPSMSIRCAAEMYEVPYTTLHARIHGRTPKREKRNARHILTSSEEETLVEYILKLDSRGFSPRLDNIWSMANLLLATRHARPVGKLWPHNFVQRRTELKTRFSRAYDF